MTAIVGVVHDGKVLIGADSGGVGGWTVRIRKDAKVFANGPYVMGFTTSFRMGQILRWGFKPAAPGRGSLERFMCTTWVDAARKALSDGGWAKKEAERDLGLDPEKRVLSALEAAERHNIGVRGPFHLLWEKSGRGTIRMEDT